MTAAEAVKRSVALYPECDERAELTVWLSELEARICIELYGGKSVPVIKDDTVLLAPDAYAELYPLYLVMKTDLVNADVERYNNSAVLFENAYAEFANFVTRTTDSAEITHYTFG